MPSKHRQQRWLAADCCCCGTAQMTVHKQRATVGSMGGRRRGTAGEGKGGEGEKEGKKG